jgi:tetratricopeptide (TPR) repeat protein
VSYALAENGEDADIFSSDVRALERVVAHERAVLSEAPATRSDASDEQRAIALWRLGEALYRLRRLSEAIEPLEAAERAAELLEGKDKLWARSRSVRVGSLLGLERWEEAVELSAELVRVGRSLNAPHFVRAGLHLRAAGLKATGRWQEAAEAAASLRASLPAELTRTAKDQLTSALLVQAWAAQQAGDPSSGLPFAEEALALLAETDDREALSRALTQRAELLRAAGNVAEARAAFQTIIDTFGSGREDFEIDAVAHARVRKLTMRLRFRR